MTHFGILCFPELGHLNPMIALGRELQRRGHNVTFFEDGQFGSYVDITTVTSTLRFSSNKTIIF